MYYSFYIYSIVTIAIYQCTPRNMYTKTGITNCNEVGLVHTNNSELENLCPSYELPFYEFRNIFCQLCILCPWVPETETNCMERYKSSLMVALLNFKQKERLFEGYSATTKGKCNSDQVFDIYKVNTFFFFFFFFFYSVCLVVGGRGFEPQPRQTKDVTINTCTKLH